MEVCLVVRLTATEWLNQRLTGRRECVRPFALSATGKVIAASAILLIAALGLFAWMRRAPASVGAAAGPGGVGAGGAATSAAGPAAGGSGSGGSASGGSASGGTASGGAASGDAALPPGTTIGPNGVVFHNPAITGKPP